MEQYQKLRLTVIDGQGGKMGLRLIEAINAASLDTHMDLYAVGTNSIATASMIKGGGVRAASGENAVLVAARLSDIIVGPVGIVIADALLGEITPAMACAVGSSRAIKILLPVNRCENRIVGCASRSLSELISDAVDMIREAAAETPHQ